MGLQFADINADGSLDIVTATFDGSPHVAYGSLTGFREPVRLVDAKGERLIISSIWDYEKETHLNLGRSLPDQEAVADRCISALAFDWDADGDHDLLLGSYEMGRLFLQMNEGSDAEPRFTGKNIPVMAGDSPWQLDGKMTAPKLVDWDGDGDMDLIAGSFGADWGGGKRGGVFLALNQGKIGAPSFAPLRALIVADNLNDGSEPSRPDVGLYPDAVDWDGDGDLDLIVGGYSMWTPAGPELSDEDRETLAQLEKRRDELARALGGVDERRSAALTEALAGIDFDLERERYDQVQGEVWSSFDEEFRTSFEPMSEVQAEIEKFKPGRRREAFVWYYERRDDAEGREGESR